MSAATKEVVTQALPESRAEMVKVVRGLLGRTQSELASALGLSVKTVQSYEQGWRNVPTRMIIQLLVFLALHREKAVEKIRCWQIRGCSREIRETCPSFTITRGKFCWSVASRKCAPVPGAGVEESMPCMTCPVVARLLQE
jgi:DNA-binding transcriptional regulator YiaG